MSLNVTQKLIQSHLAGGRMQSGGEIALRMDQTLTQDATGTMVMLEFEAMGIGRVRTELSAQYVDHNLLQTDYRNADDHLFLRSACRKFGVWYSRPGNGVSHPVHMERFGVPGKTLVGSDSHTTAAGGMDAITQLIESCISKKAKPIPQALAAEGLRLAVPAIAEAVENGASRPARERMAHAALLSGMALANSGLGFAHGVAPVLGTHCRVAHGLACALLLPTALRVNREIRRAELAGLSRLLYGESRSKSPDKAVDVLIGQLEGLCRRVGVPARLGAVGVKPEQIPAIARESLLSSSMKGNPRELAPDELARILEGLL